MDFFIVRVESNVVPSLPSGEELYDVVSWYDEFLFDF
jgi:hypothetical protein